MSWVFDNKRWMKDCVNAKKTKGLSYRDLSKLLPVSHTEIHRVFVGKKDVEMKLFILICARLDLEAINYFDEHEVQLEMF